MMKYEEVGPAAGALVRILAGRDAGRIGIIVAADAQRVEYADGKYRKRDNPKRKNRKHVQVIGRCAEQQWKQIVEQKDPGVADAAIREQIRCFEKEVDHA